VVASGSGEIGGNEISINNQSKVAGACWRAGAGGHRYRVACLPTLYGISAKRVAERQQRIMRQA